MGDRARHGAVIAAGLALLVTSGAAAQHLGDPASPYPLESGPGVSLSWGADALEAFGADNQVEVFHASRFIPHAGSPTPYSLNGYMYTLGTADVVFWTQLELPAGASVDMVCWVYYDSTTAGRWELSLIGYESAYLVGSPYWLYFDHYESGFSAAPGYAMTCRSLSPAVVIRNFGDLDGAAGPHYLAYVLRALTNDGAGSDLRLFGATVRWKRTVSPAPATATFSDVPVGAFGFAHVEALAASGITAGCGGGRYCPDDPITRAQLAVFLAKALGLHFPY